jgi:hypothetical protein
MNILEEYGYLEPSLNVLQWFSQALDSGTYPPTHIAYVLFQNSSMSTHKFALFMISVPAVR